MLSFTKQFIFLLLLAFTVQLTHAQHMSMHHQATSSTGKNVFLLMMDTMMMKMEGVSKAVSPESDFMLQMIPHHEGAIDMANFEIKHGKDFAMIQLAKSILAEQTNEVQQMKLWLKQVPVNNLMLPEGYQQPMNETMVLMMQNMPVNGMLTDDIDRAFASVMIPHHQAAVDMAKVILKFSLEQQTNSFAKHIISSEQVEIEQMTSFVK